jgi:exonuclease III
MNLSKSVLTALFLLFSITTAFSKQDTITAAFWNLENLFDTIDHPETIDEEFLPSGEKQWTEERLNIKLENLSKVIRMMNNGNGPHLLGVCEVEHEHLLQTLISKYFPDKNFKIVYAESPDERGIDNGLIYDADHFKFISSETLTIPIEDGFNTRYVLTADLLTKNNDTLKIMVNHWPSRRGGEDVTNSYRISAGITVRNSVDKAFALNKSAKIIIMGDFNDEPNNESIQKYLKAEELNCTSNFKTEKTLNDFGLFNLSWRDFTEGKGTYKYRENWNMLDQIIISSELAFGNRIKYICNSFEIFMPDIMVEQSGKFAGTPFPTYGGRKYLGGFSDHFPVISKFVISE